MVAKSPSGPRTSHKLPRAQRDEYDNIILLCPSCHALIDKNPKEYSVEMLQSWKARHEAKVISCFVVPVFENRAGLRAEVKALLRRNKALFDTYGPYSTQNDNPLDDRAETWQRMARTKIIPNNRQLVQLLLKNAHLLKTSERQIMEAFRLHAEALEYNHLSGDKTSDAPLFPIEMSKILDA
ncbi:MAG: hypothetical protein IH878_17140 [Gemmatimonadetes bacterium]|nr:hypothetical protein [Gemmatimonadota bacterium]